MEEGDGKSTEAASTVDVEEQQHEHHLRTLYHTGEIFQNQTLIESLCVLCIEGRYLLVDILDGLGMACPELQCPTLQTRNTADNAQYIFHQTVLVAFREEVEGYQTEHHDDAESDADGGADGQVADEHKAQVDKDAKEPEPEVGEEMHHGIEDDTRRGMLLVDILREFHDTVGFATQSANRCGVVQGIARDGQSVDAPETDGRLRTNVTFNDGFPSKGIQPVDHNPYAYDRYQPVAGMAQVLP